MEIPPPSVPAELLADWRQTDRTVDSPFSTPVVSAHTHTVVYEESTQRERIFEQCGVDHPWKFFFASRLALEPPQSPNRLLSSLIRKRVSSAFVDRLADRGLDKIEKEASTSVPLGGSTGHRFRYSARLDLDSTHSDCGERLRLPIEAYLVVWTDDGYRLAGGAYPGRPKRGPPELVAALTDTIEPTAAREELLALIAGCVES